MMSAALSISGRCCFKRSFWLAGTLATGTETSHGTHDKDTSRLFDGGKRMAVANPVELEDKHSVGW